MRIDAHHHLWDLKAVYYPWLMAKGEPRFFGDPAPIQRDYLIDEFTTDAKAHGFAGSVHIQVGAENPLYEARWVQSVAQANPDWPLVQVAFCDLTADSAENDLDQLQSLTSLRGVRQIVGRAPGEDAQSGTNFLLDDPRFAAGLKGLAQRGLGFDLQLLPELMEKTAKVLEQAPDTKIALCHAGSPHDRSAAGLAEWSKNLQHLSALPNVVCKLSGLGMFDHSWTAESIRPIVETVLEQFGPERAMFGSNFPVDSLPATYAKIVEAYETLIPTEMQSKVFAETAIEFYDIPVPKA
ncbi:amidohydrolase family protein [Cognatishimia maritima]|uniref:Predicted metal-dependent hydrolase, TIM-barrel fold n=1 Tax=Cognatishimia maritima TaxID=870908 RepID=A0A1M5NYM7_9RHOB|nr:amidohydrolase family protein [Cognatishimia maritima]SHG94640.1 Predicted metal-dependent hydrolase, TIM-barrel fold [Cognatishimia maritima]